MWCNLQNIGVAEDQHSLGLFYKEGVGVPQDFSEAFNWYSKSSENGCATAANNITRFFNYGKGVEKNLKKAEQYYLLACSRKEPKATRLLALLYLNLRDPESARNWYERAIDNGR